MVAVEFINVSHSFGSKKVIDGLSLRISSGQINVLLGPNGAGKTTTLQVVLGLIRPDRGEARVLGQSPDAENVKTQIGYVPQELTFPPYLTAGEVLDYACGIHSRKRSEAFVDKFGLQSFLSTKASQLSGGQKRRLGLALAFLADPKLIILDEPTTGLDLESKVWFWNLIKNYSASGGAVLLTTHDIYEISAMNCEGLLLNNGQAVASGSMDALLAKAKYKKVSFSSSSKIDLSQLAEKIEKDGNWYKIWTREPEAILKQLVRDGVEFTDLQIERGSLEEVLFAMGGSIR